MDNLDIQIQYNELAIVTNIYTVKNKCNVTCKVL